MNMELKKNRMRDGYCRICLKELEDLESTRKHVVTTEVVDILYWWTKTSFKEDPRYPRHLCEDCYNQLNMFDSFRQICITSQKRLFEVFSTSGKKQNKTKNEIRNGTKKSPRKFNETDESNQKGLGNSLEAEAKCKKNSLKGIGRESPTNDSVASKDESGSADEGRKLKSTKKESFQSKGDNPIKNETQSILLARTRNQGCHSKRIQKHPSEAKHPVQEFENEEEIESKNSSKVFQCELCSMRFFAEHRYTAHKRTHDGLIPYPCPRENCERGFERYHSLSEHLKQHDGTNRWFTCDEENCKRQYKHKATLDLHLRRFHEKGPELKSFVCEVCGKLFKSSAILKDHLFTHIDKSKLPFACHKPQCQYRFSNRAKLKIHLMRHAGIKNLVCPHCGMRKTTRNELNIHINYHTLERRFPCRFCSQVCNNSGNLKVHIRTVHERAKDYACRYCERTFAKPDTRKYHEMLHTGEKPHQCSDCGKRFVQPAALRAHKKIHLRQQLRRNALQNDEVSKHNNKDKIKSSDDDQPCLEDDQE